MYFQPKVRLSDGRVAGAEALIRWNHPERGVVAPDEFIPLVEKTVLLAPLTSYVMEHVMRQWRVWADEGMPIPLAINLSPRSLLDRQLPETVARDAGAVRDAAVVPSTGAHRELPDVGLGRSNAVLDELSGVGVSLSIDDFGTGYSSLSHLKQLPIDEIKIDRSFVIDMHDDGDDFMIVRATVELGKNLGLRVVAEGVEDRETFDRLADFGCDEAQGYYISRPMPLDEFGRWLSVRTPEAIVHEGAAARTDVQAPGVGASPRDLTPPTSSRPTPIDFPADGPSRRGEACSWCPTTRREAVWVCATRSTCWSRSEPFERLLLERARPIVARAEAGEDFVVAGARDRPRGARARRGPRTP